MKTVFFLNCTDTGSTGKIIKDTAQVAKEQGYRCVLCAPNITEPDTPWLKKYRASNRVSRAVAYRLSRITGNRYGMGSLAASDLIRKIRREKTDLVHIHCANGNFLNIYQLLRWLKKNKMPTVVTNHAEFFYTGNCEHAFDCDRWMTGCGQCPQRFSKLDTTAKWHKKMRKCFAGFSNLVVTSVSPWVLSRSKSSPIMAGTEQRLVRNGVNTTVFHQRDTQGVWERYGIAPNGKRVILYVTACFYGNSPKKGSEHFLRLAEKMTAQDDVLFVVAGRCVPGVQVPSNTVLLGRISDQNALAQLYSAADLTLITSQRETFSMPVAESLCCGTPIVGFCAGGPESIAMQEYAEFVAYGNVDALQNIILQKWLQYKTPERSAQMTQAAAENYSWETMAKQYLSIYKEMIGA